MHKLEKRQALESNQKGGNKNDEPEVVNRLICPQDFLGQGGTETVGDIVKDAIVETAIVDSIAGNAVMETVV